MKGKEKKKKRGAVKKDVWKARRWGKGVNKKKPTNWKSNMMRKTERKRKKEKVNGKKEDNARKKKNNKKWNIKKREKKTGKSRDWKEEW